MLLVMQASLACVSIGGVPEIDPANFKSKDGKELISQGRNMSFFQQKTLRVRRLYDSNRQVMVYIAYSTRLTSASDEGGASTGRYKCDCHLLAAWLISHGCLLISHMSHANVHMDKHATECNEEVHCLKSVVFAGHRRALSRSNWHPLLHHHQRQLSEGVTCTCCPLSMEITPYP